MFIAKDLRKNMLIGTTRTTSRSSYIPLNINHLFLKYEWSLITLANTFNTVNYFSYVMLIEVALLVNTKRMFGIIL